MTRQLVQEEYYLHRKKTTCSVSENWFAKAHRNARQFVSPGGWCAPSAPLSAFVPCSETEGRESRSSAAIPQTQSYKLNICVKSCLQMSWWWWGGGGRRRDGRAMTRWWEGNKNSPSCCWRRSFKGATRDIQLIKLRGKKNDWGLE